MTTIDPAHRGRLRRANDWLGRYPLAVIGGLIALLFVCIVALAVTVFVQGGAIGANSDRLDRQEAGDCLEAVYEFAQANWIDSISQRPIDPAVEQEKRTAYVEAARTLIRFALAENGEWHEIPCVAVLPIDDEGD